MKVGLIQCTIISVVFAIVGYVVSSSASLFAQHIPLTVALSLLISGIVTPLIASLFGKASSDSVDVDESNVETLYVGNLPYRANETAVKEYFSDYISVKSVRLMKDRKTGKRKGYGFIEVFTDDVEGVISKTNDSIFQERTLKVRPAKDKVEVE